ncbi:MAG: ABC transporter substrate-binding protein, partial [Thermodesulfobacteriota bacterium]|nr:ABC transporter substrate-binding protein [Thermodesulfobacteriota bacterium]
MNFKSMNRGEVSNLSIMVLVALLAGLIFMPNPVDAKPPIKIGINLDYSGPFSRVDAVVIRGMHIYLDMVDWKVAGRSIKLITGDNECKPKATLEVAKRMIKKDSVHLLAGVTHSGCAIALKGYVNKEKIPYIMCTFSGAEALTLKNPSPYVFRITYADG